MIKDCARDVLLKLTTDIHEASRGLSATAELVKKLKTSCTRCTKAQVYRQQNSWWYRPD